MHTPVQRQSVSLLEFCGFKYILNLILTVSVLKVREEITNL